MSSYTIETKGTASTGRSAAKALQAVIGTEADYGALVSRLALAAVIFPHGAQKVLGWFGGHGFSGTMGFFTQQMGIPATFAFLAIVAEFFGAIALAAGLFGRVAALGIGVTMAVAAYMVHLPNGFFMNGGGADGIEYFILAIGLALTVLIKGSGALSFDRVLSPSDED